jgi:hypothetical protein
MKSHFFHLMPYKHLPEDFAQRHRSIWVDVPASLYDPIKGHANYNEYLDELEYADQAGFDGPCVNEHHSKAYGMMTSTKSDARGAQPAHKARGSRGPR